MKKSSNLGILALLGASFSWGTMGVLVRFLNKEITPFSQILFRFIVALCLASISLFLKKIKLKLASKKDYLILLTIGISGYGLSTIFYTFSILNTTISAAVFLLSLYVVFTPLFSTLFLKEKITKKILISVSLALLGVIIIFNPTGLLLNLKGNLYGLIAGVLAAVYFVGSRQLNKNNSSEIVTFYTILLGVLVMLPVSFLLEQPTKLNVSLYSWIFVLLFALANFTAFYLVNIGFSKVKASIGSIILLMENVFATLLAFMFFKEIPGISTFIGAILIILSVIYLNLGKSNS